MHTYKVQLIYGWCGNLRLIVAEHLEEIFKQAKIPFRMTHQSIWKNPEPPDSVDLVLQLMPAFSELEAGCTVINIKPLLADLHHKPTVKKISQHIESHMRI